LSEASLDNRRKILAFAAIVEVGTGLALMVDSAIVAALLLGVDLTDVGAILGRLNRPGSSRHSEALNLGANRRCYEQQALPGRIQD
jgi:hypothetical protein